MCEKKHFSLKLKPDAYVVKDATLFGVSDRDPVVGQIHCLGTEPALFECSHAQIGWHGCGLHLDVVPDIAVSCFGKISNEPIFTDAFHHSLLIRCTYKL